MPPPPDELELLFELLLDEEPPPPPPELLLEELRELLLLEPPELLELLELLVGLELEEELDELELTGAGAAELEGAEAAELEDAVGPAMSPVEQPLRVPTPQGDATRKHFQEFPALLAELGLVLRGYVRLFGHAALPGLAFCKRDIRGSECAGEWPIHEHFWRPGRAVLAAERQRKRESFGRSRRRGQSPRA